jgi:hypothetical protein
VLEHHLVRTTSLVVRTAQHPPTTDVNLYDGIATTRDQYVLNKIHRQIKLSTIPAHLLPPSSGRRYDDDDDVTLMIEAGSTSEMSNNYLKTHLNDI